MSDNKDDDDNQVPAASSKGSGAGGELVPYVPAPPPTVSIMSGDSTTTQTDNVAEGDIAGRDINKPTNLYGNVIVTSAESQLARLYRELQEQAEGDEHLTDYIDQLQIFTREVEEEDIIGLDGKFTAAGREDQLGMAKAMKELIYRRLRQNLFSRTFQTIYATLMGSVYERFEASVRPAIQEGATRQQIDQLVHREVILPIVDQLEKCPDCKDAPAQTVRGMLYFLTGNCHVVWH